MSLEINATIVRRKNVPQGFFAIVRDISEKKSLEEKLRQYSEHLEDLVQKRTEELSESEKRYSVLVEEASDGVMILQDKKIVFANKKAAEIIGYTRDEVNGLPLQKLVDEKYLPLAEEMYERNLRGNAPMTFEVEWRAKSGEHIPIEVSGARIYYKGRPAILRVARDIRNRKRMEEQRLKLEKLAIIGELATMVAHDLRNPLTSIKNACFYLKNTCPPRDGAECKSVFEMVEILEQETAFANAIINDLLDFAVKRPLEKKRKNINNIINRSLKKANMAENVKIERDFALRPIANVDEEQLERVFLNLIKNAAQAMPEGGRLTVGTSVTADRVEVVVRDTGTGIAKENMSKIFQPLFTTKAKGIGMGLAICKRIVEEHSGTIDAESEVGKGTVFLIKLPKNVEALAQ
jgi:two-component system sporulation sensor kinase A